jgi:hypothetical protein
MFTGSLSKIAESTACGERSLCCDALEQFTYAVAKRMCLAALTKHAASMRNQYAQMDTLRAVFVVNQSLLA